MNRQILLRAGTTALALLACAAAQAHPGHGINDADSLLHLLEAEHVLPLLAAAAVGWAVVRRRARRRRDDERRNEHDGR